MNASARCRLALLCLALVVLPLGALPGAARASEHDSGGLQLLQPLRAAVSAAVADPAVAEGLVPGVVIAGVDEADAAVDGTPPVLSAAEGGASAAYSVRLAAPPTSDVVVDLTPLLGQTTAAPSSLTFDASDWHVAQIVNLTAVDDEVDEAAPHADLVMHVVNSDDEGYASIDTPDLPVDVVDDDDAGVRLLRPLSYGAAFEAGAGEQLQVVLDSQPLSDVRVQLYYAQVRGMGSITFTPADWDVPRTFVVEAVDDRVAEGVHEGTVDAIATGDDEQYSGAADGLRVRVVDDDVAAVMLSPPTSRPLDEALPDAAATYRVRLRTQPVADVTVAVVPDRQVRTSAAELVFSPANWEAEQVVSVWPVDDGLDEPGHHPGVVSHTVRSGDAAYGASALDLAEASFDIVDDDEPQPVDGRTPSAAEHADGRPGGRSGSTHSDAAVGTPPAAVPAQSTNAPDARRDEVESRREPAPAAAGDGAARGSGTSDAGRFEEGRGGGARPRVGRHLGETVTASGPQERGGAADDKPSPGWLQRHRVLLAVLGALTLLLTSVGAYLLHADPVRAARRGAAADARAREDDTRP